MFTNNAKKILVLLLLFSCEAYSQPYYFFPKFFSDRGDINYGADIYRVDLSSGNVQLLVASIPRYNGIIVDPTEQWAYINFGHDAFLLIQNISDTSKYFNPVIDESLAGKVDGFAGVIYLPLKNRFYVTWMTPDTISGNGDISRTTIYDATTFKRIGDIDFGFSFADMVSPDNNYIYQYAADSLGHEELDKFSTSTNSLVSSMPFLNAGPSTENKAIVAGNMNRFVFQWQPSGSHSILNNEYSTYDVTTGMNGPSISFPWSAEAYLSADGNYVIINPWRWANVDTIMHTGHRYFPGTVYVFDASTGQLTQRLTLPPNGKILVFNGYPQMFYYYNDSTNQSVPVNATTVTPTGILIDTLIALKHQAVANGWLKDSRNHNDDIDEMMRDRNWYDGDQYKEYWKWHPDESWDFDHDWDNGIVQVLDKRLDKAKTELSRKDSVDARRDLEIFVMEVEVLNSLSERLVKRGMEPIITSDGYTLLKMNAEYLIDRLPEKHGIGDEGEGREEK